MDKFVYMNFESCLLVCGLLLLAVHLWARLGHFFKWKSLAVPILLSHEFVFFLATMVIFLRYLYAFPQPGGIQIFFFVLNLLLPLAYFLLYLCRKKSFLSAVFGDFRYVYTFVRLGFCVLFCFLLTP